MGKVVYAAAMSHVLFPDYYAKNVGPHGRAMVEELIAVVHDRSRRAPSSRMRSATPSSDGTRDGSTSWVGRCTSSSRSPASAGIDLRFRGEQERAMNSGLQTRFRLVVNYEIPAR
jgi:hypothetical protein